MQEELKRIVLANPRGFCAGVDRAIAMVNTALDMFGAPIYVKHEIVHNKIVVKDLEDKGAIFVEEVEEIPEGAITIYSAHGVSQQVRADADKKNLQIFDATCPLVTKVHMEVARHARHARNCILIGHAGHPEVEGTLGQYHTTEAGIYLVETVDDVAGLTLDETKPLAYVSQTTLSVDETKEIIAALKARFPHIQGPKRDDICYATQNRQDAVKLLAQESDVVLVVGSVNSSNSNRLRELAEQLGTPAYLIDTYQDIDLAWLQDARCIGITAGASAPEVLVKGVITHLSTHFKCHAPEPLAGIEENMVFAMPKVLRVHQQQAG